MRAFGIAGVLQLLALACTAGPAAAHDLSLTIDNCACEDHCYTAQVSGLACEGGEARFHSDGLPADRGRLMQGIRAWNQQFPTAHDFTFTLNLHPRLTDRSPATRSPATRSLATQPGAIGVAVDGVPLFDPSTQGPVDPATGQRPSAFRNGELDACGGHAGRGDDYHYHVAPKCLIEALGREKVDEDRRPIGFAMDGFPILALGWFDPANDIEGRLDRCRGIHDAQGAYFYNVMHEPDWLILNCLRGADPRGAHDNWRPRRDAGRREIVGVPLQFAIDSHAARQVDGQTCQVATGRLTDRGVLRSDGRTADLQDREGTIFYCNPHCYGQFFEAVDVPDTHGRVIFYERPVDDCPAGLDLAALPAFTPYEGPPLQRAGPAGTGPGGGPGGGPPDRGPRPPRPGDPGGPPSRPGDGDAPPPRPSWD